MRSKLLRRSQGACWAALLALVTLLPVAMAFAAEPPPVLDAIEDALLVAPSPPSAELAYQELSRNSEAIDKLRSDIEARTRKLVEEESIYHARRRELDTALLALAAGRCKGQATPPKGPLEEAKLALRALNRVVKGDVTILASRLDEEAKILCTANADLRLLSEAGIKEMDTQLDEWRAAWVKAAEQENTEKQKLLSARLQNHKRLGSALDTLRGQRDTKTTFVSDLKWLVMILGVLSVAVMLIVRAFPVELQTEWVASGQVIQFMTVLIILITILALGITGVLKENTLGTLLGGIGGYVLSQGIGRAAARSALRNAAANANSPPGHEGPA
ncbi:MAG: hypothetical protein JNJ46_23625 [Myxococcales bacterium]|nr:hypothetical protein [Myxococcales bacterium]